MRKETAFPLHRETIERGMSLLDYFAAQAMQAEVNAHGYRNLEKTAEDAYRMAQVMMQERKKHY